MAIDLFCYVNKNKQDASEIISRLQRSYVDLLTVSYVFSHPTEVSTIGKEIASDYGFNATFQFLLSLNVKSEIARMREAENILKSAFGEENILILWENELKH